MVTNGTRWSVVSAGHDELLIEEALTEADKRIVIAAAGPLAPTTPEGTQYLNALAARIAMDRVIGTLTGPVTDAYLCGIAGWPGIESQVLERALFVLRPAA